MSRSLTTNIFFSCASGALIGGLLAEKLNVYFWWVGALLGGVTGALIFVREQLPAMAASAWTSTRQVMELEITINWQTLRSVLKGAGAVLGVISLSGLWAIVYVWLGSWVGLTPDPLLRNPGGTILFGFVLFILNASLHGYADFVTSYNVENLNWFWQAWLFISAFTPAVIITVAGVLLYAAYRLVLLLVKALKAIGLFLWALFKLVHSRLTVLVFCDTVLGVVVGHFYHQPLYGALVGGLLGAINYRCISIGLLKLVPTT
jgi:hypothetical protein